MRLFVCALAATALFTAPVFAQTAAPPQPNGVILTVAAQGKMKYTPNIAYLSVGVETRSIASASDAMAQNATTMTKVIATLGKLGIAQRDIQTNQLNVNPQYQYNSGSLPRITGYQATNQVSIKIRDLKKIGNIVDTLVAVGSTRINGVSFGLEDYTAAQDAARTDAINIARTRAELYAKATGLKVGRMLSVTEAGAVTPVRANYSDIVVTGSAIPVSAPATPVAPGELSVGSIVSVTYVLN